MVEKNLSDREAKCPFLQYHTNFTVVCEGLIPGTTMRSIFRQEEDKKTQWRVFCCGRYENCEIYRALMALKYEEED